MDVGGSDGWLVRHTVPVFATLGLLAGGMGYSMWWCPHVLHTVGWGTPGDLWRTVLAAQQINHLDLSGVYTRTTALVTLPGGAIILSPAAAVVSAFGWLLGPPLTDVSYTLAWIVVGPYEMLLSATALFAFDAVARTLNASDTRRWWLAGAEAVGIGNVAVHWGHPEDVVAVALLTWAILLLSRGSRHAAAWLVGAAVSVQPLVLLAVPALAATVWGRRQAPGFIGRLAVLPFVVTLGPVLANPAGAVRALVRQPNDFRLDRPTPWIHLAPRLSSHTVAAGPGRLIAIALALTCGVPVVRALRRERLQQKTRVAEDSERFSWTPRTTLFVIWWVALALSLRCAFEPVMVGYYLWPGVALGSVAAIPTSTWRFPAALIVALALTYAADVGWRSEWGWWGSVLAGIALLLAAGTPVAARNHRLPAGQEAPSAVPS